MTQSDAELMLRLVLNRKFGYGLGPWNLHDKTLFYCAGRTWQMPAVNGLPVLTPELRQELERLEKQ